MSAIKNQDEMSRTCPGVLVGRPTPQCRYLMNLKERGALPSTVSTDCNPGVDNPNCARNTIYLARQ